MGCIHSRCRGNDEEDFEIYIDPQRKSRFRKREELPMIVIMEVDGPVIRDPQPINHSGIDHQDDYVQFPESTRKSTPEPDYDLILDMVGITTVDVIDRRIEEIVGIAVIEDENDEGTDIQCSPLDVSNKDDVNDNIEETESTVEVVPDKGAKYSDDDDDDDLPELSSESVFIFSEGHCDLPVVNILNEDEDNDFIDESSATISFSELRSESWNLFTDSDYARHFVNDHCHDVAMGKSEEKSPGLVKGQEDDSLNRVTPQNAKRDVGMNGEAEGEDDVSDLICDVVITEIKFKGEGVTYNITFADNHFSGKEVEEEEDEDEEEDEEKEGSEDEAIDFQEDRVYAIKKSVAGRLAEMRQEERVARAAWDAVDIFLREVMNTVVMVMASSIAAEDVTSSDDGCVGVEGGCKGAGGDRGGVKRMKNG